MWIHKTVARAGAALAVGSLPVFLEWSLGVDQPRILIADALISLAATTCIAVLAWTILPRLAPRILRLPFARKWSALLSLTSAIALAGSFAAIVITTLTGIIPAQRFWIAFSHSARIAVLITVCFSLSVLFHEILADRLNRATTALKEKEIQSERLRQAATEARLSSLESRVHPHFLFNTLNSIGALIRENPAEAERMVERLSVLLRRSLDAGSATLVPLETELATVRNYLEIEQVRFGNRLRYSIEADPALSSLEVPPFSLQTLVENSVKYAVSPNRLGASIAIRAALRDGQPAIDVLDDGPGFSTADLKSGHGLDLLQSRLAAHFGPASALEIARDPGITRVTVLI